MESVVGRSRVARRVGRGSMVMATMEVAVLVSSSQDSHTHLRLP